MKINRKKWTQVIIIILAVVFEERFYSITGISQCVETFGFFKQLLLSALVILGAMHILSFFIYRFIGYFYPDFWAENKQ